VSNKTYTQITTNLRDWLEDDSAEFTGSIDEVINLAEMRLWKDLDLSIFSTSGLTAPTALGITTVTKPISTDIVTWQSLYYDVGGVRTWLELRSYDYVIDHQTIGVNSAPKYYAELSETQWLLSPIPDAIYTLNLRGIARPTRLAVGNPTTWLSTHQDDLLFKCALAEAEGFLKADDREPIWMNQYRNALPLAKRETHEMLNQHYHLTPLEVPAAPVNQAQANQGRA